MNPTYRKPQLTAWRAAKMLQDLAAGLNPLSRKLSTVEGPTNHPLVIRALAMGAAALEAQAKVEFQKKAAPDAAKQGPETTNESKK
jgi:hypothetical protein